MSLPFKKGDLVVCIDDKIDPDPRRRLALNNILTWVVEGRIYKIRDCYFYEISPGVYLDGVFNNINYWTGREAGFQAKRFRKFEYKSLTTNTSKKENPVLCSLTY